MATPTLNLAPDVQTRYNAAMSDPAIANDPGAVQLVTQKAQEQSHQEQASSTPQAPSYKGIKGVFLNNDSPLNLQNIGGTLGMLGTDALGAVLAPETGGLSLAAAIPAGAALAAGGSVAGKAAQNKLTGQKVDSNLGSAAIEGGLTGAGGPLIGKATEGITGLIGSKLLSEGDDAAVKSIGLSQGNRNAFFKATGQTTADFLKEHNLAGEGADAVQNAHDVLQTQYNNIARNSGVKVSPSVVRQDLLNEIGSNDLVTPLGGKASEQALSSVNDILKNIPKDENGNIDIGDLTKAKSDMQSQTNFNDPTRPGETQRANEMVSSALKQTVDSQADPDGTKGLSTIGNNLNKFKTLLTLIGNKEPGQVGSSTLSKVISHAILPTTGTAIGAGIGGIVGGTSGAEKGAAIGGTAAGLGEGLLSSPFVLSKLATILPNIASKIAPTAGDLAGLTGEESGTASLGAARTTPNSMIRSIPGKIAGNAVTQATGNELSPSPSLNLPSTSNSNSTIPTSPSLSANPGNNLQDGITALQSGQPLTTEQYTALTEAVGVNPKLKSYIDSAYQASNPAQTQGLNNAANTYSNLQNLYNSAESKAGPLQGSIGTALGKFGPATVQEYNKQSNALGQEIINQIYPNGGTDAETRAQIMSLIPTIDMPPEVAQNNLRQLKNLIQQKLTTTVGGNANTAQRALNMSPSLNL